MNQEKVTKFIKGVKSAVTAHSPEILTGLGIAGMITTTVLAVKATPKALELIEVERDSKKTTPNDEPVLSKVEIIKAAWKPYIPAAVTGVVSTACLIGASSVSARRNAALATAYQLSTTALNEYKEKVVETIGEKKEKTIREKIAQDKVSQNPVSKNEVIFTGKGETLCFDAISGRYFKSDRNKIERAVNNLNHSMTTGMNMYMSLNEFYDEIDVPRIPMGEELGWRVDKGLIDVHFGAVLTENDEPCMVLEHLMPPEYGFRSLY